jgi:hypothetical protein
MQCRCTLRDLPMFDPKLVSHVPWTSEVINPLSWPLTLTAGAVPWILLPPPPLTLCRENINCADCIFRNILRKQICFGGRLECWYEIVAAGKVTCYRSFRWGISVFVLFLLGSLFNYSDVCLWLCCSKQFRLFIWLNVYDCVDPLLLVNFLCRYKFADAEFPVV